MPDIADDKTRQRSVLITGCSSGIGYAAAQTMQARGWRVFVCARQKTDVTRLDKEGFETLHLDYRSTDTIEAALAHIEKVNDGKLDAIFNNGAIGLPCALEDLPDEAMRELFDINFFGWHELTRRVIPIMRRQGHGRIVQCSSVLGFVALKYRGAYNASKYALEGYSDTLRIELSPSNIYVSLIEPGPIATRFGENSRANFDRLISPEIIAGSAFQNIYQRYLNNAAPDTNAKYRLPAQAVVDKLVHALEASRPKARYYVTRPTKLLGFAKRAMPGPILDKLLSRVSDASA